MVENTVAYLIERPPASPGPSLTAKDQLMITTQLGRTGLNVTRTAFGVLPLQRTPMDEAERILRRAFDAGINYYDTARYYTDSEEKIGRALSGVRDKVIIATKSGATTREGLEADLQTSLRNLKTDYIDILQLHNPKTISGKPAQSDPSDLTDLSDPNSPYAALLDAKEKGLVRHIGITNHSRELAIKAVESGVFETLQFPLCHISSPEDLAVIDLCKAHDVGLIAMKPLSGGLLTEARPAFAFLRQFENVVPIWGFQRMEELEEMLALDADPPSMDEATWATVERDRRELSSDFCRACGYCLPCSADIPIPMAARMILLLRRMPYQQFMTDHWRAQMRKIESCTNCGHCISHCPYGLDTPALLRKALEDYDRFVEEHAPVE